MTRYLEFLDSPRWPTYMALNYTSSWFMVEPAFQGLTWMFSIEMFDKWGWQLNFVGFN